MSVFLCMVLVGGVSALIYDLFRILRKSFKHKNIFIYIEDFIYWLIIFGIMFFVLLRINHLELRLFEFIGFVLGMILYFVSISKIFVFVMVKVLNFVKLCIKFFIKILFFPIHIVLKLIMSPINFFKKVFRENLDKIESYLKNFKGGKNFESSEEPEKENF